MSLQTKDRIYVAWHRGLAGSALVRALQARDFANLLLRTHVELDLTDQAATRDFFECERPDHVFLAAARVGGIHANDTYPAEFIRDNLAIQTNVIHEVWRAGVRRLLFLSSSCIYPRDCPQPMREGYLLTSPLETTHRPYALTKIAGIEMCWSYNRQYGTQYLAVMPTNLYGSGDNYHPENSHVIPALIRKFHEAKTVSAPTVKVWGTGTPRREFLYSDDMADACLFLMGLPEEAFGALVARRAARAPVVNIGIGEDLTIRELAEKMKAITGFTGEIEFDPSRPDGTPRKLLDTGRFGALGWRAKIGLDHGLAWVYRDFLQKEGRA